MSVNPGAPFCRWNLDWIQENLALNLQLQLLETLLSLCLRPAGLASGRRIDELIGPILAEGGAGSAGTEAEKALDALVERAGPQVLSLSSFKVSRQFLTCDLNHVLFVSLLITSSTALANLGLFELTG